MKSTVRSAAVACCFAAGLASPAAASALTKTVYAGPPPNTGKLAQKVLGKSGAKAVNADNADVNDFFQDRVTINQGDTVKFLIDGFHTVDLPGKANTALPFFVPGATVTGDNDAAGSPFWFNGHVPSVGFNLKLLAAQKTATYNGTKRVDSGVYTGNGNPPPLKVTFSKPGVYKYFCDIHPGMVGFVVVKPKHKSIPSAKQDATELKNQQTAAIHALKTLSTKKPPADHVSLGEAGPDGTELYAMFPATLSVNAGTVVTFSMSPESRESHTATFGPTAYLTTLSNSLIPTPEQQAIYPSSNPAAGPIQLNTTSHGNGFANTGILDTNPATPQTSSEKIDFTAPGTYHFICLIHPFMTGTIVVH